MEINLGINICGLRFPNPFVVYQLPPTGDVEIISSYLAAGWGAVVLRPSYLNGKQKQGSGSERSVRYPLYRGTDYEEKRMADLGWIESRDQVPIEETERIIGTLKERFSRSMVIGSMIGSSRDEWLKISRRLSQAGADMIECDMTSCISGGVVDAGELKQMEKVAGYLRDGARNTPVVVKLPGLLSGRREVAATLKQAGADALNIYYEPRGIPGINLANFVPFPNVGQKSALCMMGGAAVKPYTLAMLAQWGKVEPGLPLSVLGGVHTWRDTVESILMGASLVHFHGAVLQRGIGLIDELKSGVTDYLEEKMISSVDKLVGKSLPFICEPQDLPRTVRVVASIDDKLCTRCGNCFRVCSGLGYQAISFGDERKPSIDRKKCVGDGLCVAACPITGCMSLRRVSSK